MIKHFTGLLLLIAFWLVGCGGTPAATPQPTSPAANPQLTSPVTTPADAYPVLATITPESYPIQQITPTIFSYPAGVNVWMTKPVGMQCQESAADLEGAVTELESAGISVLVFEMIQLAVCEACDVCPTSDHYRVQLSKNDQEAAQKLGWRVEP